LGIRLSIENLNLINVIPGVMQSRSVNFVLRQVLRSDGLWIQDKPYISFTATRKERDKNSQFTINAQQYVQTGLL